MTDNIIPFNPNPDFVPFTDEELEIYHKGGLSEEEDRIPVPYKGPDKELCSLFIFEIPIKGWSVGFVSLSENICSKEEFYEQIESICEAYRDNIYITQEECIEALKVKYFGMFSSIVIFC